MGLYSFLCLTCSNLYFIVVKYLQVDTLTLCFLFLTLLFSKARSTNLLFSHAQKH